MRAYLRNLPHQPLAARRRFVVIATVVSFVLVVLVWAGMLFLGRGRRAVPNQTASPSLSPPAAGEAAAGGPASSPSPVPEDAPGSPASRLNVDELSADLLKVLGDKPVSGP